MNKFIINAYLDEFDQDSGIIYDGQTARSISKVKEIIKEFKNKYDHPIITVGCTSTTDVTKDFI